MLIIIISFLSGILSVLAPCVLPVIPVLFGGGLAAPDHKKTLRILFATMFSIFIFTFLLKVSTAFIGISTGTRAMISGVIVLLYGLTLLFPQLRARIQLHIPQIHTRTNNGGKRGDYLLGASLGPIFASCSPTYSLLLATILPADITIGVLGLIAYMIGFGGFLYILVIGGHRLIQKFYAVADTSGWFKRFLGCVLVLTGLLIATGYVKKIETRLIDIVPNIGVIESRLLQYLPDLDKSATPNDTQKNTSVKNTTHDRYLTYDENNIPTSGDIVLFFHADRCPTCRAAEEDILATPIPTDLTILKVDYDTATDLKKKYSVLTQSSYVLIQPDGTLIKRWIGGTDLESIITQVKQAKEQIGTPVLPRQPSGTMAIAYFAGGCFRCMEGPFEALDGVSEVTNGYAGGDADTATYEAVSSGKTKHREAVKIVYDPALVSYTDLLDLYRRQIDPTDAGGQFADRGYQYTPAIYYQTTDEQQLAEHSKQLLEEAKKFADEIAVEVVPFTSFYPAETYHQDYYKKQSPAYERYKKGSGRSDFLDENREDETRNFGGTQAVDPLAHLTATQRHILFEGGTEPPFDNAYRDHHETGIYVDVIDGTPLFSSLDKFDSGTGRPAFTRPIDEALLSSQTDTTLGMERTEIKSSSSSGHLGHVFDDGPAETGGKRFCINSAALRFVPLTEMEKEGYSDYLSLFTK